MPAWYFAVHCLMHGTSGSWSLSKVGLAPAPAIFAFVSCLKHFYEQALLWVRDRGCCATVARVCATGASEDAGRVRLLQ